MAFFEKLNQMAKNIGDKAGDAIETGKLNSKIGAERSAAAEALKKIGEHYYNLFTVGGEVAPEVLEFCQSAKAHYDAAAEAQAEIARIKAAYEAEKTVPTAVVPLGAVCPSCGAANSAGTKFCQNCGVKLDAPAEPQERKCPGCGAVAAPGVIFCSDCGQRMEE